LVLVCAWCDRFLGVKEPAEANKISHGICDACFAIQTAEATAAPTLVLSKSRPDLLPVLQDLLSKEPEIRVILDRRRGRPGAKARNIPERRRGSTLVLV
jgi:hypothetical protein